MHAQRCVACRAHHTLLPPQLPFRRLPHTHLQEQRSASSASPCIGNSELQVMEDVLDVALEFQAMESMLDKPPTAGAATAASAAAIP